MLRHVRFGQWIATRTQSTQKTIPTEHDFCFLTTLSSPLCVFQHDINTSDLPSPGSSNNNSTINSPVSALSNTPDLSNADTPVLTSNPGSSASTPTNPSTQPRSINKSGARSSYEPMKSSYEEQWGLADRASGSQKAHKTASPRDGSGFPKDQQQQQAGKQKEGKGKRVSISSPVSPATGKDIKGSGLGIQGSGPASAEAGGSSSPSQAGGKGPQKPSAPSQKSMTKAERRELQEKQKAEKAARLQAGLPASGKKAAQVLAQPNSGFSPNPTKSLASSFPGVEAEKAIAAAAESTSQTKKREKLTKEIGLFAHLDPPKFANTASAHKDLHPAVVNVGLQMAQFKICGANARCVATMSAFRKVLNM